MYSNIRNSKGGGVSIGTVMGLLAQATDRAPNKTALIDGNESITYRDLFEKVNQISEYLISLSMPRESRVVIYSNKSIDQVVAILSVLSTSYIVVPISNLLKEEQVKYILDDCNVECVITDKYKIDSIKSIKFEKQIVSLDSNESNVISFKEIYKYNSKVASKRTISSNSSASIIYSSGSTGFPKGIVSSHKNLVDGAKIVSSYLGLQESDNISGVLSFNFDYGLNQIYCSINMNATLILHSYFLPINFYKHLIDGNITVLPLMPVFLSRIFNKKMIKGIDASLLLSVRIICSSGGRVTQRMLNGVDQYFKKSIFFSMYGLTEAFRSTFLDPSQIQIRPTSIGKAIPDVELYIINENGNECQANEVGELIHRGGCIGKGYWNRHKETKKRYKSINILNNILNIKGQLNDELVVCSGDYAYKDGEGYIYFVSRKDDMIKSSGYRISPDEIEGSIYQNIKEIRECAVFSVEDEGIGEKIIMAFTADNILDVSDIQFVLKKHLPSHMIPKTIFKLEVMPTTTANQGKINKKVIKLMYEQGEYQ